MDTVKLYILDQRKWNYEEAEVLGQIAPYYARRYRELAGKKHAWDELAAGYLLASCLGICSDDQWIRNVYGKPKLVDRTAFFNLSHSGDYAVLAVSDGEVGVDIQQIRSYREASAKRILREETSEEMKTLDETGRQELFAREWSRLEAALKLQGTGFAGNWDRSAVDGCYIDTLRIEDYFLSVASMCEVKIILIHVSEVK